MGTGTDMSNDNLCIALRKMLAHIGGKYLLLYLLL